MHIKRRSYSKDVFNDENICSSCYEDLEEGSQHIHHSNSNSTLDSHLTNDLKEHLLSKKEKEDLLTKQERDF